MPAPVPASVQADRLLRGWERHAAPVSTPAYAAARRPFLAQLVALCELVESPAGVNVDYEDVRTVLKPAHSLAIGTGSAWGPHRAGLAVERLFASLHLLPAAPLYPARYVLLTIVSPPSAELGMDELSEITASIQGRLGEQAEMIFGHETARTDAQGLQIGLLIGYAAAANVPFRQPALPAARPLPPPPDANGRDAAFAAAAHLVVQQQLATGPLLQRELKLGYNQTHRILEQLTAAGIIGAETDAASPRRPVLLATLAELDQLLGQLPPLAAR